jgi:PhnB protein
MKLSADDFRRQYADLTDEALLDIDPLDLNETARACYHQELASRGMEADAPAAAVAPPSAREYVVAGVMESREDAKKACEYMKRQYIPASVGPDGVSVMVPPAILHEAEEVLEGWLPGELYEEATASATYVRHGMGTVRSYVYGHPDLIEFVQEVFGAVELERFQLPHGAFRVESAIGDSVIVLEVGNPAPAGGKPSTIHIYVPDVDAAWGRALELGATEVAAPEDKEYNERAAAVSDSSGNIWWIATYQV